MLFLLFGSSASGKTTALRAIDGRVDCLALHDFDEVGVPPGATLAWRHRQNEAWVRRALAYQEDGIDLLLAGQTPYGELLAAPSADRLDGTAACLLDVDDETRLARIERRGPAWLARVGGDVQPHLGWAEWMRGHAADPSARQQVMRSEETDAEMRWDRLDGCEWNVTVIDASHLTVEAMGDALLAWIDAERAR